PGVGTRCRQPAFRTAGQPRSNMLRNPDRAAGPVDCPQFLRMRDLSAYATSAEIPHAELSKQIRLRTRASPCLTPPGPRETTFLWTRPARLPPVRRQPATLSLHWRFFAPAVEGYPDIAQSTKSFGLTGRMGSKAHAISRLHSRAPAKPGRDAIRWTASTGAPRLHGPSKAPSYCNSPLPHRAAHPCGLQWKCGSERPLIAAPEASGSRDPCCSALRCRYQKSCRLRFPATQCANPPASP